MVKKKDIVLLTGAGFSSIVGLKTLKSIIEVISVPIDTENETVSIVTNTWKVLKGQKGDNATLEDLLAKLKDYIEMTDKIAADFNYREIIEPNIHQINNGQTKLKLEKALSYCFRLILNNYGPHRINPKSKEFNFIHKSLKLLATKNTSNKLHVFTTNYDCLLNVLAAKKNDMNYFSHINNENGRFENKWFNVNKIGGKGKKPSIYMHRLHGCIGWFSDKSSPYGIHEVYGAGKNLRIDDPKKINQMAIKLISDEKLGEYPAFLLAFEQFEEVLYNSHKVLVWGHSFKDLQVLKSIINTIKSKKNGDLEIYFIDPFLNVEHVIGNIQNTIRGETGIRNNIKNLNRIDWEKGDGLGALFQTLDQMF